MRQYQPRWIDPESWKRVTSVIRSYPDLRRELETCRSDILFATAPKSEIYSGGTGASDPTHAVAVRLGSPRMAEMERKIRAFERAWEELSAEQKKVIAAKYWISVDGKYTSRQVNLPYVYITGVYYSADGMKRIVKRFVARLGYYLGEVD